MNRLLLLGFVLLSFSSANLLAQNLTGIWRGYFITEDMEQYSFEVQIEHNRSNMLSGVTYSYLDKRFYGKSSMTGNFTKSTGNALIQEIKTLEVKMSLGSVTCIQKCLLTYTRSGREQFLEGEFKSKYEKTDTAFGYKKGGNCGGGTMYLRKVTTSDFYIEPFLRNKTITPPAAKNNPPVAKPPVTKTTTTKPPVSQKANNNTAADRNNVNLNPKKDSINKAIAPLEKNDEARNLTVKPKVNVPLILKQRQNDLVRTLIINTETVSVRIYDNGEIDDDSISVYLDNQLILSKKRLTASALTINLKMDESNDEHELVMVAENLGRIPPNTSLMIVTAGDKRFEVRITSTEQKNAVVKFKYVKPDKP